MKTWIKQAFVLVFLLVPYQARAQDALASQDPRQMAIDIYVGVTRGVEPANIALRLKQVIELFRYSCARVTDYQVFSQRPNITDFKVKCSGSPLFGVTVASNGFVSVYGGNQIVAALDRRDGLIFTFSAGGDLSDTSALDINQVGEETKARFLLGDEYDYIYLSVMLIVLLVMAAAIGFVLLRLWRHRKLRRRPRGRMKPMKKFTRRGSSSDLKDRLLAESTEIEKYVHRHDSGIFIAVGKRGKRRLFKSAVWAKMYARYNFHFFEVRDADITALDLPESVDIVDVPEGEEYIMPDKVD